MTSKHCLNCVTELVDAFCSDCGQKTDTRHITFKKFLFTDVLHGSFSIERGMLFTTKQAMVCPGKAALDILLKSERGIIICFFCPCLYLD